MFTNPLYMHNPRAEEAIKIRQMLLQNTDWTQTLDSPLSAERKAAFATYRQALRDLPKQEGFPDNFNWPPSP